MGFGMRSRERPHALFSVCGCELGYIFTYSSPHRALRWRKLYFDMALWNMYGEDRQKYLARYNGFSLKPLLRTKKPCVKYALCSSKFHFLTLSGNNMYYSWLYHYARAYKYVLITSSLISHYFSGCSRGKQGCRRCLMNVLRGAAEFLSTDFTFVLGCGKAREPRTATAPHRYLWTNLFDPCVWALHVCELVGFYKMSKFYHALMCLDAQTIAKAFGSRRCFQMANKISS